MQSVFTGPVYVVRDNIDTDQIIPAQFLNLVPTIPEEYEKLGSYALWGLPEAQYPVRFVKEGKLDTDYPIVVAGRNFGCGSSREHAPIALGSAGCRVVQAESFARIFFRNGVSTGALWSSRRIRVKPLSSVRTAVPLGTAGSEAIFVSAAVDIGITPSQQSRKAHTSRRRSSRSMRSG
jgi:3-isopropylmalate dehydratase small subunit